MPEEKTRLARLSAIITQLQSKNIVTARSIAKKHNVSVRTIYRDIRTLQESGIPIVTKEGKGYTIMEGYKLPPVMFTEEEANALIMAEHLILKNKDKSLSDQYQNAITKIKSILRVSQREKNELLEQRIQVRNNNENEKTSNFLIEIQTHITNFRLIRIQYTSLKNQQTEREIEPFALYTTQENWILIAYCRMRRDFRAFRLDRIQKLIVTSEKFSPHKITLEQYLEQCRKKWLNTPDIPLSQAENIFAETKNNIMQKVTIKPFMVIGISIRTTNQDGRAAKEIPELWGEFMSEGILDKIPNKINNDIYSMYTDYEGDHKKPYTTIVGCKVSSLESIPAGMVAKKIDGGNYVKTTAKGDLMKGLVINKWSEIWQSDLDRAYTTDFELYGEKTQNPSNAEVDFYISINIDPKNDKI